MSASHDRSVQLQHDLQPDLFSAEPSMLDVRWLKEFRCPRTEKEAKLKQAGKVTGTEEVGTSNDKNASQAQKDQFQIGDVLIYPVHGIVRVVDIQTDMVAGQSITFYLLKIDIKTACDKPLIKLPVTRVEANHVKPIIRRGGDTTALLEVLRAPTPVDRRSWNKKYVSMKNKLSGGDLREVAEVLRDLIRSKHHKDMSHSEMRLIDQADALVVKSLAIALDIDEGEMRKSVVAMIG